METLKLLFSLGGALLEGHLIQKKYGKQKLTQEASVAMSTPNPEPVLVKELADKYKCSICTNLLDTPVLTECCGQHFCKACLEK